MSDWARSFDIGDKVIHWTYGIGEVIQLDEKILSGHTDEYYVVRVSDLTLWVPATEAGEERLRPPTPAVEFKKILKQLSSPGIELSKDRYERKVQLDELLKDHTLESICRVVRDLAHFKHVGKLNEHDNTVLERSKQLLLKEWCLVLSVPMYEAEQELRRLLKLDML